MFNDAVGKADVIALVRHCQRTTIANQNPDIMAGRVLAAPGDLVEIQRINALDGLLIRRPKLRNSAYVQQGIRCGRVHEPKEKFESLLPPQLEDLPVDGVDSEWHICFSIAFPARAYRLCRRRQGLDSAISGRTRQKLIAKSPGK